jgi:hypothetical protein
MLEKITAEQERQMRNAFEQLPPAQWVQDMVDHRKRTGTYRPGDLRRLLGDPKRSVDVGPNASLSTFLAYANDH